MTKIQMHKAMGLIDKDMESIDEEMNDLLKDTKNINSAAAKIAERHDARAVLVGMRFLQLIQLNDKIAEVRSLAEKAAEKSDARQTLTPPSDPDLN